MSMQDNGERTERLCLDVSDVVVALGLSKPTVLGLIHQGVIPSVRVGRRILVPRRQLEAWLATGGK